VKHYFYSQIQVFTNEFHRIYKIRALVTKILYVAMEN